MIIVSRNAVKGRNERHLSYDDFVRQAFSEEGLDVNDKLMINIHDMNEDVYMDCAEAGDEQIGFFSLTGACPNWCDPARIQDWSTYAAGQPTSQPVAAPSVGGGNQEAKQASRIEIPDMGFGVQDEVDSGDMDL